MIPKASLKDEGAQAYLYTQQPGNLSNVGQITNYKQLQNQLQHTQHTHAQFKSHNYKF